MRISLLSPWTLLEVNATGELILRKLVPSELENALNSENYFDICVVATKDDLS